MKHRFFIILFCVSFFGNAQEAPPPPESTDEVVIADSAYVDDLYEVGIDTDSLLREPYITTNPIYPKKIDEKFRKKYQTDDFNYSEIKPKESFWERLSKRIRAFWESIFGKPDPKKTSNFTQNLLYVVSVVIIAFVLYFLIKYLVDKEGTFIFSRKNKKIPIGTEPLHENIHEINFPDKISELESQKEFRLAIRYRFLQLLKVLEEQKLIEWNPEKTNHDYALEIKKPSHRSSYDELSYIFDYVWYGEFDINEESYAPLKQKFLQVKFN